MFASESGEILVIGMFVFQAATEQNIQHLIEMNPLMQMADCVSFFLFLFFLLNKNALLNIEVEKWKFFSRAEVTLCALCWFVCT